MKIIRRLLLGLLTGLGLIRAVSYFWYAAAVLPSPFEAYFLEAKMVLLAYRAELGLDPYPAWRGYPHVTNFYGPVYFGSVGQLGRAIGADIPGLFQIGRLVSFGSGLLTSLLVGVIAARRYGRGAGFAGAVLSIATGSMTGFSVMTRPDLAAEFLGVAGFFLAIGRAARGLGVLVLVLAMLTKQTAALFVIAAVLAWVREGDWRRGLGFGVACALVLGLIVGGVTLTIAPNFAGSLLGETRAPWDLRSWILTATRIGTSSPDVLFFPLVGLVVWSSRGTGCRDAPLATLAAVLLATSLATSAKLGSDVNYYLSLRVIEILAVGALWRAWALAPTRLRSSLWMMLAVLGCVAVVPGASYTMLLADAEWQQVRSFATPQGREQLAFHRIVHARAADPRSRLLTDSGMIQLYQGDRAPFGDPFLFRSMVNLGRIDPTLIRDRINARYYDLVITTRPLDSPSYDTADFGLPKTLADRVRERYVWLETRAGLSFYGRPPESASPPRQDPRPEQP